MTIVSTERLVLRQFCVDDADAMMGVFGDVEVMMYGSGVKSIEQVREWIGERASLEYSPPSPRPSRSRGEGDEETDPLHFDLWAVVEKATNTVIGYCGLSYFPDIAGRAEFEIGYRLVRSAWGRGYATEAAAAVRDYGFERLGLTRMIALIDPENARSIRVAEKIGLAYEKDVILPGYTSPDRVYVIERGAGQILGNSKSRNRAR